MKKVILTAATAATMLLTSCSENYSNGERIGVITQFSESGLVWKSWEGHLNATQTGIIVACHLTSRLTMTTLMKR